MGRLRKQDQVKYCDYCGVPLTRKRFGGRLEDRGRFQKRKFCSLECMGKATTRPPQNREAASRQARKVASDQGLLKKTCETCGSCSRLNLHHIDGDNTNNTPSNLMTLCASCHTTWHWRHGKNARQKATCSVCGKPASGLGLCQKHYQRYKRHGDPLLVKMGGRKLVRVLPSYSQRDSGGGTNEH
jgi:hypothetical protein